MYTQISASVAGNDGGVICSGLHSQTQQPSLLLKVYKGPAVAVGHLSSSSQPPHITGPSSSCFPLGRMSCF